MSSTTITLPAMPTQVQTRRPLAAELTDSAIATHRGRTRRTNEDRCLAANGVYAVADGVAGGPAGEVASTIAISELACAPPAADEDALAAIVTQANRRIHDLGEREPELAGMATTLTAARLNGGELLLAHVGDSRAYRLRNRRLERLTEDHSFAAEAVRRGILDPDAAARTRFRRMLTRALGMLPDVVVDTSTHEAQPGDLYLLCTDGLTTAVSDQRLAKILGAHQRLELAIDRLTECALEAGALDDITVVLFRPERLRYGCADRRS
jgi:serine/threonine protein phosphatase PrpC